MFKTKARSEKRSMGVKHHCIITVEMLWLFFRHRSRWVEPMYPALLRALSPPPTLLKYQHTTPRLSALHILLYVTNGRRCNTSTPQYLDSSFCRVDEPRRRRPRSSQSVSQLHTKIHAGHRRSLSIIGSTMGLSLYMESSLPRRYTSA